jgi:hypothetical protein
MERTLDRYSGGATFEMTDGSFSAECRFAVRQTMIDAGGEWLPGMIGWTGTFTTGGPLAWTGEGTIVLEDGRKGKVLVTNLTLPAGYGTFTGSGPAPAL